MKTKWLSLLGTATLLACASVAPQPVAAPASQAAAPAVQQLPQASAKPALGHEAAPPGKTAGVSSETVAQLSLADCRKAAERGLAGAQVELGKRYESGRGVARDLSEARRWYEKAAAQQDSSGQLYLGRSYNGYGPDEDPKRALQLYELAAAQGNLNAQMSIGLLYYGPKLGRDFKKALESLRPVADAGDANAQHLVGLMHREGKGVAKDDKRAFEWCLKAAEQGYADAMSDVGYFYELGEGVPRDLARAKQWYERGAAANDAAAQVNLGLLYENGTGVDKSQRVALEWYRKAAAQGHARGALLLGWSLRFGDGPERDAVEGCRQLLIAAKAGLPRGQYDMGRCLESGDGVARDEAAAAYWYAEAAKQNIEEAAYRLGLLYLDGRGVAENRAAGAKLLAQAATLGDKNAARELANLRERQACAQHAKSELFGVKLSCAGRRELRSALARSSAKATRVEDDRWYDEYETSSLLDESRSLELWYTRDNAWLARARYDFPSSLDVGQVARIAEMVSRKYGAPSTRRGHLQVGDMYYGWVLGDGVRLSVWRGWPDTTTYVEYENPRRLAQMKKELADDDRKIKQRQAASQSRAF